MLCSAEPNVVGRIMIKAHWKSFISFVAVMMVLSSMVVKYGIDAQFRGYPLPFLSIESGIGDKTSFGWSIPNLLVALGLCMAAASAALAASRQRVAARNWLFAGLGVALVIGVTAFSLWHSVGSPITDADELDRAAIVSTAIRHLLAAGTLTSAVCFFVYFLKKLPNTERVE